MSMSNALENALALLLFNNTAIANIGDAAGIQPSDADGNLYVSLHTSDPGEGGDQESNEADYTSYARAAVERTSSGWTVSANAATNASAITFPQCTGGENVITHFGIGTASSGPGVLLFSGELNSPLAVSSGITPSFAQGALSVSFD